MNKLKTLIGMGAATTLLAACASAPPHSDSLDRARAEVQTLGAEPLAQQAAANDLQAAQQDLQDADAALAQKRPMAEVDHLAYLAQRHAEAGIARVETAHAQAQLARAQDQRSRILLESRAEEADRARAQANEARSQLAQTQQELADLKAKQTDRGMVVTLADVLFDTGRATLKPGADLTLDHLARYMRDNPHTRILVEGFTDSVGSDAYNDELSQRRADSVAAALATRGVPGDAIRAIGRGKSYPVATNDTPAGRQQNRRVQIVFSDTSGRFAEASDSEAIRR
jgi:outer membrane protein OmpA-like peptidoglycan-associated protein